MQGKIAFGIPGARNRHCSGVLTMGRMMFQPAQEGNGENLENRVFACILLYCQAAEQSGLIDRPRGDVE